MRVLPGYSARAWLSLPRAARARRLIDPGRAELERGKDYMFAAARA